MAGRNRVYHWKHGWIPLDHAAALKKAHGSEAGARRLGFHPVAKKDLPRESHVLAGHNADNGNFSVHDTKTNRQARLTMDQADQLQANNRTITGVAGDGSVTAARTEGDVKAGLASAESERKRLEAGRYNAKGRYNGDAGWDNDTNQAWKDYTEMGHTLMNQLKRDPEGFRKEENETWQNWTIERNANLEKLIAANRTSREMTVARGVTHDVSHLQPGDHLADPAFLSTTTNLAEAQNFASGRGSGAEGWMFVINVPEGTNAVAGADYQSELVFGPGQAQQVQHIDRDKRIIYTTMGPGAVTR